MKYIYYKIVKEIELSELDFVNQDKILGIHPENDSWEYQLIENKPKYYIEAEEIEIDSAIKTLEKLKKAGANYTQIVAHVDHHGYEFYGLEMREATKEEVEDHLNKDKKDLENAKQIKINELEKELTKLKS